MKATPLKMLPALVVALCSLWVSAAQAQFVFGDIRSPETLAEIRTMAEMGHFRAQATLAWVYRDGGVGVPKNESEAVKWYRKSAEQGYDVAQAELGYMYNLGQGVERDTIEAYKWWLLAGAQGNKSANRLYPIIERGLTDSERAEGQRLAKEFRPQSHPTYVTPPLSIYVREPGEEFTIDELQRSQRRYEEVRVEAKAKAAAEERIVYWRFVGSISLCGLALVALIALHLRRRFTLGSSAGTAPNMPVTPTQALPAPPAASLAQPPSLYVLLNGNEHGPITKGHALDMVGDGQLQADTPAWKEGLAGWKRLDQVLDMTSAVSSVTRPPPPMVSTQTAHPVHSSFALTQPVNGAHPGIRFLARFVDLVLFSNCFVLVAAFAAPFLVPTDLTTRGVLIGFLWCFVEAALLPTWGTTPGKAFLKICVRNADGSKLNYSDALSRAFDVWFRGLGMLLPWINLLTLVVAYNRLASKGTTSWDKRGNYRVTHGTVGPARIVVSILLIVSAFVAGMAITMAAKGAGGR